MISFYLLYDIILRCVQFEQGQHKKVIPSHCWGRIWVTEKNICTIKCLWTGNKISKLDVT